MAVLCGVHRRAGEPIRPKPCCAAGRLDRRSPRAGGDRRQISGAESAGALPAHAQGLYVFFYAPPSAPALLYLVRHGGWTGAISWPIFPSAVHLGGFSTLAAAAGAGVTLAKVHAQGSVTPLMAWLLRRLCGSAAQYAISGYAPPQQEQILPRWLVYPAISRR